MRVIRSAGQNVSPADDGRLYSKAFADGLFEDVAISSLGTNLVSIGALYGIICGRDFTAEAQNINVVLPETEGTTEGVIYVEIDISSDDVITIGSALKPFTPTYEDINMNGVVAQMVIAEYTATPVAVTDITSVYPVATAGGIGSMATIELSPVQNSYAVGDFLVWKGQLYKVIAAIASGESLVIGTNIEAVTIGTELTALNKGLIQYGESGIWKYHKYADGTYHLWYDGNINLLSGTAWIGGYYHNSSSDLPLPSFAKTVTSVFGASTGASLTAFIGADMSTRRTYWLNGIAAASTLYVHIDAYGTW